MTRKKVKLTFITNDSARKATFKKRKRGLMKKVSELSTLCGIEACVVIYSPYDSQPEIWPSQHGVQRVLTQFKKMPEMEQSKKMVNQETFLRQRIIKANEQLKKQRKENREKEMTRIMFQCLVGKGLLGLNIMDLNDLGWLIDQNLKDITKRMEILINNNNKKTGQQSSQPPQAPHDHAQPQPQPQPEVIINNPFRGDDHDNHDHQAAEEAAQLPNNNNNNNHHHMPQKQVVEMSILNNNMLDCMQLQRQTWFMDLGFVGSDDVNMPPLPFADHNHNNALWSNAFFP